MALPAQIARLIETFEQNREDYLHGRYSETQLRREYLDPFFKALGWDVDNTQGYAEAYKDVIHEDAIRIGSATKAPDYCFRIGGTRKFFVEAKAPTVNLKDNPEPAYQVRRYAWSAKLPLSILTDFEEFAVYDCRIRPALSDKASKGRVKYYRYTDYAEHWDEIASIFSRDAVLKGSFDKYAASEKRKQGTAEVDAAFLAEIEDWRDKLAHNIALRNPKLTDRQLNYAVQITIDRVIFLRICEDRGIERYGELMALVNGADVYQRLMGLFRKADDRYNSGLFHFQREKDRHEGPDELTPELAIDDKPLKEIIRSLYYPDSPYEFSVLPAEILGQVYEQFLGKVIVLTAGHHAKVEDKPEVKKAGGVFYTPSYIVDYIVKQTVGKLLEGASVTLYKTKPPKLDRPLRVLDPACGSGSFLLGAYQLLLDWHLDYYQNHDPKSWAAIKEAPICSAAGDGWKLTTRERKRILLDHIYGVDIDTQAVEVTKLSLLLKVLEGEKNLVLFHDERALPDLSDNIKCGNSLIGSDFYKGQQLGMFNDEERFRINAFDWRIEFPDILGDGGFDAVIGNPPYVDVKILSPELKPALAERYKSATQRFDLYIPFVERGLSLLRQSAYLAFIMPTMFARREYGRDLRSVIRDSGAVQHVVDFGTKQVFSGAMNYVGVFVIAKGAKQLPLEVLRFDRHDLDDVETAEALRGGPVRGVRRVIVPPEHVDTSSEWHLWGKSEAYLFDRLAAMSTPLGELLSHASEGIHSGKDDVFFVSRSFALSASLESPPVFPLAKGKDIHRYDPVIPDHLSHCVIYPYDLTTGHSYAEPELEKIAPTVFAYLKESRARLAGRPYFDRSSKNWYELWCPREPQIFTSPKIVGPEIAARGEFSLCKDRLFINNKLKALILREGVSVVPEYLLGLLNSQLLTFVHRCIAPPKGGGFFEVKTRILCSLPIRVIDRKNPVDRCHHDDVVLMVEAMLQHHKDLATARTPGERTSIERQIVATDREIDRLVYELYGLTEEEIRIVEGATQV